MNTEPKVTKVKKKPTLPLRKKISTPVDTGVQAR